MITSEQRNEIESMLADLHRKRKTGGFVALLTGFVIGAAGFIITLNMAKTMLIFRVMFIFMLALMTGLCIWMVVLRSIKKKFKIKVLPLILRKVLGENTRYVYNGGYDKEYLAELKFFPITTYTKEDMVSGTYKNVDFIFADILMQHQQSTGKTSSTVTDFRGTMWTFTFNKPISSRVDIKEKSYHYGTVRGMSKIEFEDMDFNDKFKAYATDEHDAFYVITPRIIQALKDNLQAIEGKVMYSIQGKKLFLVIASNHPRLEFRSNMKNVETLIDQIQNDVTPIFKTIDAFNLVEDIYSSKED